MRSERGSASLELALTVPGLLALLFLIVLCGRSVNAQMDVDALSRDAARAASVERSVDQARSSVQAVVAQMGNTGRCRSADTQVDQIGPVDAKSVAVTVRCTISFRDLAYLGIPTSKTFTSRFVEPLDEFRGM